MSEDMSGVGIHWRQGADEPPRDREIYIVTDDGRIAPVRYSDEHKHYLNRDCWTRTDGEAGSWELCDIEAWAEDYTQAEGAALVIRSER